MKYPGASALALWLMFSLTASPLWATEIPPSNKIALTSSTSLSSEGYFVLFWKNEIPENAGNTSGPFHLLQATNAEMHMPDSRVVSASGAITVSGLSDGMYFFRVSSNENLNTDTNAVSSSNLFSNIVQVEVKHHSLHKALIFFSLGLILLIVLCFSIFVGNKFHKRDHS